MSNQSERIVTLLLIENDDETRRLLIEILRDRPYRILLAINEDNAIEWLLSNDRINIDLILMNQVKISRQECQKAIAKIYQQTSLSSTIPSVIMAERYHATLEGTEEKVGDNQYIIYLEDVEQLFNFIHQLCFNE
ncbi:MAG: hypothetical protein Tsb0014_21660 [Pleurocapsa sp.]